ncbi:MAG: plasmid pRiA4b ORF-3 family protein [Pleomorphochaeta sp.]
MDEFNEEVEELNEDYDFTILNVKINNLEPSVYRRVVVPEDISLDRLSDVILVLFNWKDYESCSFKIKNTYYVNPLFHRAEDETTENINLFRLNQVTKQRSKFKMYFENWEIGILVEKTKVYNVEIEEIYCLSGANYPPPSYIDDISHYYRLLEAYENPEDDLHQRSRELFGEDFDKTLFNIGTYNFLLSRFSEWARDRDLSWYDDEFDKEELTELFTKLIKDEAKKIVEDNKEHLDTLLDEEFY